MKISKNSGRFSNRRCRPACEEAPHDEPMGGKVATMNMPGVLVARKHNEYGERSSKGIYSLVNIKEKP
jgi:hypothetical protein